MSLIEDVDRTSVLDAGCGTGVLTEQIALHSGFVTGVDFSSANIRIAQESEGCHDNVRYIHSSIENYSACSPERYSLIVANMVLQDVGELDTCLLALARVSAPGASLIATITHPCFWPAYWGYDKEEWFRYIAEQAIEAPFKISSNPDPIGVTTHFHRPLSRYISGLHKAGFVLDKFVEPMPATDTCAEQLTTSTFPRFIALRCFYSPDNK